MSLRTASAATSLLDEIRACTVCATLALVPMGFCFPGTGNGGDLPPRPECAPLWRGAAGPAGATRTVPECQAAVGTRLRARASATLMPSTAADRMPPAKPAPSPAG